MIVNKDGSVTTAASRMAEAFGADLADVVCAVCEDPFVATEPVTYRRGEGERFVAVHSPRCEFLVPHREDSRLRLDEMVM